MFFLFLAEIDGSVSQAEEKSELAPGLFETACKSVLCFGVN
jgi:hypothetical protein